MITFHLKPKNRVEGTEYDRQTEYASVSVDDNGLEFYETDTGLLYTVVAGAWLAINSGGVGSSTFLGLSDTPASFTGAANQLVAVNAGETALEFVDLPTHDIVGPSHTVTGAAFDLVGLTAINTLGLITPSSNPGATEKILKTNSAGSLVLKDLTIYGAGTGGWSMNDAVLYLDTDPGIIGQFIKRRDDSGALGNAEWANIDVTDLNGTGSQYDVVGFTATNTVGLLTPASDPAGANVVLLRTNTSGNINLQSALTFNAAATISTTAGQLTINGVASSTVVINEAGADVDFRVESTGNANMLFVDAGNDRVGIGGVPLYTFDVAGDARITSNLGVGTTPVTNYGATIAITTTNAGTTAIGLGSTATVDNDNYAYGYLGFANIDRGATAHSKQIWGVAGRAQVGSGQSANVTTTIYGVQGEVYHRGSGVLTSGVALLATNVVLLSTGTVTNAYGLFVNNITSGSSGNYSIYTNAGDIRLMASASDKLGLWGVTPVVRPTTATYGAWTTLANVVSALQAVGVLGV